MNVFRPRSAVIVVAICFMISAVLNVEVAHATVQKDERPAIDIAIALDVSGSMSGLIDSAKQRLWDIVNELAVANPEPTLRVAILSYGSPHYGSQSGYVKMDLDLSGDLDAVNEALFAFSTDGGSEYVGRVIDVATNELSWSDNPDSLKLIFVAGNESANQDRLVDFREAGKNAIAKGIQVNSIYCGPATDSIFLEWRDLAMLAEGTFFSINQDKAATSSITTPYDDQLIGLNKELNETYLAYGALGAERQAAQREQDVNAASMSSGAAASRVVTKGSSFYRNSHWDLVDAVKNGKSIKDMQPSEIPPEISGMTMKEREKYVEEKGRKRVDIQKQIAEIGKLRQAFLEKERKKLRSKGDKGLDVAIIDSIRELATRKGFSFHEIG